MRAKMQAKLIKQLPVANQLGEGVTWDQQTGCVWWVDILQSKLFRYSLHDDQLSEWSTPEPLCSFALCEGRDEILAAFASGIAWYSVAEQSTQEGTRESTCESTRKRGNDAEVTWIEKVEATNSYTRLNDGKADLDGNFWVGGVREENSENAPLSALYRIDARLEVRKVLGDVEISNGLCWSPCGSYVYHTDTPSQTIRRYNIGAKGALTKGLDFAKTEEGCFPDGSTTDALGRVYNAEWGGGKVRCYDVDGQIDSDLLMPVSQPTCAAFAGDDLSLLVVTSAAVGTQEEAGAGDVFIYQTDRSGFHHPRFKPK